MWGGDDDDEMHGGEGNDTMRGDAGVDDMWGDAGVDTMYGGLGNDKMYGGHGDDTMYGGGGVDTMRGGHGDDTMHGDAGDDWLFGNGGDDKLFGGAGSDNLFGGDGNDRLTGGRVGGGDDDENLFVFGNHLDNGHDTITDFLVKKKLKVADSETGEREGFDHSDKIHITGAGDLTFAKLTIKDNADGDAVITGFGFSQGASSITLEGVAASELTDEDFTFV